MDNTRGPVNGDARLKLYKGGCIVAGRRSPNSLDREDYVTFGEDAVYEQQDAEGFITLFGLPVTVRPLIGARAKARAESREGFSHRRDAETQRAAEKKRKNSSSSLRLCVSAVTVFSGARWPGASGAN